MTFENYMLPCSNKNLFGFDCMGCGFQRALLAVFQGQFIKALWLYPAIFPLLFIRTIYVIATGDFSEFQKEWEKAMEEFNQSALLI